LEAKLKILLSGSHGFLGQALVPALKAQGHEVTALVRSHPKAQDLYWDPTQNKIDPSTLANFEAVIHLAGESISNGRWTEDKKQRILDSRVQSTALLAKQIAAAGGNTKIFLSASAIGYYGNRGSEILDESASKGELFLSKVCQQWEEAAAPLGDKGLRVGFLRFGVILGKSAGALAKMLPPFRLGLGGVIGSGQQYMSWISLPDTVGAILFILNSEKLQGPINITAPHPLTNLDFTRALGQTLRRPTFFSMPSLAARLVFGEMADELLLASTRVVPKKLEQSGYVFKHPQLQEALSEIMH
jgi:uncharacterized protein